MSDEHSKNDHNAVKSVLDIQEDDSKELLSQWVKDNDLTSIESKIIAAGLSLQQLAQLTQNEINLFAKEHNLSDAQKLEFENAINGASTEFRNLVKERSKTLFTSDNCQSFLCKLNEIVLNNCCKTKEEEDKNSKWMLILIDGDNISQIGRESIEKAQIAINLIKECITQTCDQLLGCNSSDDGNTSDTSNSSNSTNPNNEDCNNSDNSDNKQHNKGNSENSENSKNDKNYSKTSHIKRFEYHLGSDKFAIIIEIDNMTAVKLINNVMKLISQKWEKQYNQNDDDSDSNDGDKNNNTSNSHSNLNSNSGDNESKIQSVNSICLNISAGLASWLPKYDSNECDWFDTAYINLWRAKQGGKNRFFINEPKIGNRKENKLRQLIRRVRKLYDDLQVTKCESLIWYIIDNFDEKEILNEYVDIDAPSIYYIYALIVFHRKEHIGNRIYRQQTALKYTNKAYESFINGNMSMDCFFYYKCYETDYNPLYYNRGRINNNDYEPIIDPFCACRKILQLFKQQKQKEKAKEKETSQEQGQAKEEEDQQVSASVSDRSNWTEIDWADNDIIYKRKTGLYFACMAYEFMIEERFEVYSVLAYELNRYKKDESLKLYKRVLEMNPSSVFSCINSAIWLFDNKQFEESFESFKQGVELGPKHTFALQRYGHHLRNYMYTKEFESDIENGKIDKGKHIEMIIDLYDRAVTDPQMQWIGLFSDYAETVHIWLKDESKSQSNKDKDKEKKEEEKKEEEKDEGKKTQTTTNNTEQKEKGNENKKEKEKEKGKDQNKDNESKDSNSNNSNNSNKFEIDIKTSVKYFRTARTMYEKAIRLDKVVCLDVLLNWQRKYCRLHFQINDLFNVIVNYWYVPSCSLTRELVLNYSNLLKQHFDLHRETSDNYNNNNDSSGTNSNINLTENNTNNNSKPSETKDDDRKERVTRPRRNSSVIMKRALATVANYDSLIRDKDCLNKIIATDVAGNRAMYLIAIRNPGQYEKDLKKHKKTMTITDYGTLINSWYIEDNRNRNNNNNNNNTNNNDDSKSDEETGGCKDLELSHENILKLLYFLIFDLDKTEWLVSNTKDDNDDNGDSNDNDDEQDTKKDKDNNNTSNDNTDTQTEGAVRVETNDSQNTIATTAAAATSADPKTTNTTTQTESTTKGTTSKTDSNDETSSGGGANNSSDDNNSNNNSSNNSEGGSNNTDTVSGIKLLTNENKDQFERVIIEILCHFYFITERKHRKLKKVIKNSQTLNGHFVLHRLRRRRRRLSRSINRLLDLSILQVNEICVDICENILIDFDKMIDNLVLNGENVFKPEIETREKAGTKAKARQDIISINKQMLSIINDYHRQKISMSYTYYKIETEGTVFDVKSVKFLKNRKSNAWQNFTLIFSCMALNIFANIARKCQLQVKKTSI